MYNILLSSQSEVFILIDYFVHHYATPVINMDHFKADLIYLIPYFKQMFDIGLSYIQTLDCFVEIVSIVDHINLLKDESNDLSNVELIYLHQIILNRYYTIQSELNRLKIQEQRNQVKLVDYIRKLTQHYSKLLFVRVDVAIAAEYQIEIGIRQFHQYLRTYINRIQNQDTCFTDLQGYAWAIEQGEQKGYHCHLLLIYDGHKHQNDYGLGLMAGEAWKQVTHQRGIFFTSNDPVYKDNFVRKNCLGIGMIYRNQPQQVQNAIHAATYLVNPEKENQHLRAGLPGMRTFGKGQFNVSWRRGIA